jgi:hypothetical protein
MKSSRQSMMPTRMRSSPRALLLAVTLAAASCDHAGPAANDPLAPSLSLATSTWEALITSTPPDPAYVGDTYQVTASILPLVVFSGGPRVWSATPDICTVSDWTYLPEGSGLYYGEGMVSFTAAGTCRLLGDCDSWECPQLGPDEQAIQVVAQWAPGTPTPPTEPGTPPGPGGPIGPGGPGAPGVPAGPGGSPR